MRNFRLNVVNGLRVTVLAPAFVAAAFATPALADDQYTDRARVLSVTPQAERVNMPRQECRTEYQQQSYRNGNDSVAGAVIGGIAGGLLGSTIGRGNGRVAAAAVGAGVGAIAGNSIGNNRNSYNRSVPVQSCYQVDNWQTVNSGYLVTYEYNGRTYTTVTGSDPGNYIDVNVAIAPNSREVSQISYVEPAVYGNQPWNNGRGFGPRGQGKQRDWDDREYRGERRYY